MFLLSSSCRNFYIFFCKSTSLTQLSLNSVLLCFCKCVYSWSFCCWYPALFHYGQIECRVWFQNFCICWVLSCSIICWILWAAYKNVCFLKEFELNVLWISVRFIWFMMPFNFGVSLLSLIPGDLSDGKRWAWQWLTINIFGSTCDFRSNRLSFMKLGASCVWCAYALGLEYPVGGFFFL